MGVLKIKDDLGVTLAKDPYDLFSIDEPIRPRRTVGRAFSFLLGFTVTVVSLFTAGVFVYNYVAARELERWPLAYFEIRVLDNTGRPVAGAQIKSGNALLGVTDSFGEWRKFQRVELGSIFPVTAVKMVKGQEIVASRNLSVPGELPGDGEIEIKGGLKLVTVEEKAVPVKDSVAAVKAEAAVIAAAPVVNRDSIWISSEQVGSYPVQQVVGMLRQRSQELGLKVEEQSPWQVKVSVLAIPGQDSHLLRVQSFVNNSSSAEFSFLRAPLSESMRTARDILWAVSKHVGYSYEIKKEAKDVWGVVPAQSSLWALTNGQSVTTAIGTHLNVKQDGSGYFVRSAADICAGAGTCSVTSATFHDQGNPGMRRERFRLQGQDSADLAIYVSGYSATRLSDKMYEYWGVVGQGSMVTALRGEKVVWRGKIAQSGSQVPTVIVPSLPLSRR